MRRKLNESPDAEMRQVVWVGSSKKDWRNFPDDVQDVLGSALNQVQFGFFPDAAKPLKLKGFGGVQVLELIDDYQTDTYRGVCTIKYQGIVFVLHAFQKKSKHGIETPTQDKAIIESRLKDAEILYAAIQEAQKAEEKRQKTGITKPQR